jgi:hypothetical protein
MLLIYLVRFTPSIILPHLSFSLLGEVSLPYFHKQIQNVSTIFALFHPFSIYLHPFPRQNLFYLLVLCLFKCILVVQVGFALVFHTYILSFNQIGPLYTYSCSWISRHSSDTKSTDIMMLNFLNFTALKYRFLLKIFHSSLLF